MIRKTGRFIFISVKNLTRDYVEISDDMETKKFDKKNHGFGLKNVRKAVTECGGTFHPLEALTMTLMINARHLFYGISMLDKYKGTGLKKLYLIFGMCDESFSVNYTADIPEDVDKGWFMFWVTALNQIYWVLGATLGGIFGSFIHFNTEGIEFVMTALFVVLLHLWKKQIY